MEFSTQGGKFKLERNLNQKELSSRWERLDTINIRVSRQMVFRKDTISSQIKNTKINKVIELKLILLVTLS